MKKPSNHLPAELKNLVHQAVALLGEVIHREAGLKQYRRIEGIRATMADLRSAHDQEKFTALKKLLGRMRSLPRDERFQIAKSFTLMLQVMNACENAYRTYRLEQESDNAFDITGPQTITFVLTSHPTEARSPQNIAVFHDIQKLLVCALRENTDKISDRLREDLRNALALAWRAPVTRSRQPKVKDEAEHIYSLLLRDETLVSLLDMDNGSTELAFRTWVGGDKDGHPGVDEKVMHESLSLSRGSLVQTAISQLHSLRQELKVIRVDSLVQQILDLEKKLRALRKLRDSDGARVLAVRKQFDETARAYRKTMGALAPALRLLEQMFRIFPALVIPLELRESSDVLMKKTTRPIAIDRMLRTLARISRGGNPRWYARGFIISMTESIEHIREAARRQRLVFNDIPLPIIPLFEETESLKDSEKIVGQMTREKWLMQAARRSWQNRLELMVGYSDSAKEGGVLKSRLGISRALPRLEKICLRAGLTPVFFHGSGGSVDRGGGSIEDQTSWWPSSALQRYKVTIQGEMIERTFASHAIAQGQLRHIRASVDSGLRHRQTSKVNPVLEAFAEKVSAAYREKIHSEEFLQAVQAATLYSDLSFLKIGSRPVKRSTTLTVAGLRAIPWVMCWTQTRVLFPTWWGIGRAWQASSASEKKKIRQAFRTSAIFRSYVKALGFTLDKIEMAVWHLHLTESSLPKQAATDLFLEFQKELRETRNFHRAITDHSDPLWYRPWLGESIHLRSAMIHPLNALQILAEKDKDPALLRLTVTGISSGLMTTG